MLYLFLYVIHLYVLFGHTCVFNPQRQYYTVFVIVTRFIHLYVFFAIPYGKRINETSQ